MRGPRSSCCLSRSLQLLERVLEGDRVSRPSFEPRASPSSASPEITGIQALPHPLGRYLCLLPLSLLSPALLGSACGPAPAEAGTSLKLALFWICDIGMGP